MIFQLEEDLRERVRRRARERGISEAQLVREALERELGGAGQPWPRSIGVMHGPGDLAERVEYLYEPPPWRS